jgi:exodeoxyribonuclease VII small subunit
MDEIKFEEALEKLEEIVGSLESGELSLDKSLAEYEEGIKLVKFCRKKLDHAKKKVEILVKAKDGKLKTELFDETGA